MDVPMRPVERVDTRFVALGEPSRLERGAIATAIIAAVSWGAGLLLGWAIIALTGGIVL